MVIRHKQQHLFTIVGILIVAVVVGGAFVYDEYFTVPPTVSLDEAPTQYRMATFSTNDEALYILASKDGLSFSSLSAHGLYTIPGGIRDPSVFKHTDGKYYTVFTISNSGRWNADGFGLVKSDNLLSWSTLPNVVIPGATNVWAPEWFVDSDGSAHVFVGISKDNLASMEIYETHPINSEFTLWSTPVLVFDHPTSVMAIDPFVVKSDGVYYLWYKDNIAQYIEYATASSLYGPYTKQVSGDWASWGSMIEGASVVRTDSGAWRIYFDQQQLTGGFEQFYSESSDNLKTWTQKISIKNYLFEPRHGTVVRFLS